MYSDEWKKANTAAKTHKCHINGGNLPSVLGRTCGRYGGALRAASAPHYHESDGVTLTAVKSCRFIDWWQHTSKTERGCMLEHMAEQETWHCATALQCCSVHQRCSAAVSSSIQARYQLVLVSHQCHEIVTMAVAHDAWRLLACGRFAVLLCCRQLACLHKTITHRHTAD